MRHQFRKGLLKPHALAQGTDDGQDRIAGHQWLQPTAMTGNPPPHKGPAIGLETDRGAAGLVHGRDHEGRADTGANDVSGNPQILDGRIGGHRGDETIRPETARSQ
ncbi:hypothetical protein D3C87_1356360 [compost metagenome]